MVNDGVVDTPNQKPKLYVFNLTTSLQASKNLKSTMTPMAKKTFNKPPTRIDPWLARPKRIFTPLRDTLEVVLKSLSDNKIIKIPDSKPWEPEEKPKWWNDNNYCDFHHNKGHKTNNYMKLIHVIQDLIEEGKVKVDGHHINNDHKAFQTSLPSYEKGESSKSNKINYTYIDDDNVIYMVEPCEHSINMITLKGVKKKINSSNDVTRSQEKLTLKGASTSNTPSTTKTTYKQVALPPKFNLMDQLQITVRNGNTEKGGESVFTIYLSFYLIFKLNLNA